MYGISNAGSFFRGPLKDVGFMDLTDRVHRSGLWDGMVHARFAPYTSRGRLFGLPHDVHPVQLAYRRDIFEKEGVEVTTNDRSFVGFLCFPDLKRMLRLKSAAGNGKAAEVGVAN